MLLLEAGGGGAPSLAADRIVASARVAPSLPGLAGVLVGLGAIGTVAAAVSAAGGGRSFLTVPPLDALARSERVRRGRGGGQFELRSAMAGAGSFSLTLCRTLLVPGLAEELLWRVALTPQHPAAFSPSILGTAELGRILFVNVAFALYHPLMPQAVGFVSRSILGRTWESRRVAEVFRAPSFLLLAFVLGCACSLAYEAAGRGLYAPVLVHGVAVAIWIDCCGGEEALRGGGGTPDVSSPCPGDEKD